jgi:hypothetical protein
LGDIDTGYALGFFGDFDVWNAGDGSRGLRDGEVAGDEEKFVVRAWGRLVVIKPAVPDLLLFLQTK